MLEAMMAAPVGDDVTETTLPLMLCRTMQQSFPVKSRHFSAYRHSGQPGRSAQSRERGEEYIVGQAAHNYLFEAVAQRCWAVFSRNPSTRLPTAATAG